jgi:hypothetical protein
MQMCWIQMQYMHNELQKYSYGFSLGIVYLRYVVYPIDPWFESRSGHFSSILMDWVFRTSIRFIY